jgi:APA family basic amino acid/polyamine antiporter
VARSLFETKSVEQLCGHAEQNSDLKRTLGWPGLILLGIGAIIGAGLFVRTAAAAANNAGPSVTLGFVIAAIGCAFAGLCYAEFASMIPVAGSAYTYAYATLGELVAWIIGWDLVLEYALGAATVAIAWSEYLNKLLEYFGWRIPFEWCHSPFEVSHTADVVGRGYVNLPAIVIIIAASLLLIRGTRESTLVNGVIVVAKLAIVVLFIICGWHFINPAHHTPYFPAATSYVDAQGISHHFGGALGVLGAGGVVFFAFIGFDAVSTAAQETKDPRRDMPIGILGSLAICTVLYVAFAHVLTGIATVEDFRTQGKEASVTYAIATYMPGYGWLAQFVTVAILAGFSSVILVLLLGQSRVFYSMSHDGLVPRLFSDVHPEYRTPYKANLLFLAFVGAFAGFVPGDIVGDMTSIGTLFAFVIVCAGVWRLRVKEPTLARAFRTPLVPLVPILGMLVCGAMIFGLGWPNWLRLGVWLLVGLAIYFGYGRRHSRLAGAAGGPDASAPLPSPEL